VLAIKGNQKTLFEDIQLLVNDPEAVPDDAAQTVDGDHGRIETRRAAVLHDVAWLAPSGTAFPPVPRPQGLGADDVEREAAQSGESGQRLHPRQDQTRRVGRCLSPQATRRRLMRLP
jgi:hypothetical protein